MDYEDIYHKLDEKIINYQKLLDNLTEIMNLKHFGDPGGDDPEFFILLQAYKLKYFRLLEYLLLNDFESKWIFFHVVKNNDKLWVEKLINMGLVFDFLKEALSIAAREGHMKMVGYFMNNFIDKIFDTTSINEALKKAALSHEIKIVEYLLENGGDPQTTFGLSNRTIEQFLEKPNNG